MADMNAWNRLQQDRGAVKALEALRAETAGGGTILALGEQLALINRHIEKYK